jgi:hypothetical protein
MPKRHSGINGCEDCEKCIVVYTSPRLSKDYYYGCKFQESWHKVLEGDSILPCRCFEPLSEERLKSREHARQVFAEAEEKLKNMTLEEFESSLTTLNCD